MGDKRQAEAIAHKRRDVERSFERSDDRDIHGRLSAVNAEIEHAQRNYRVITLAFRFAKRFDKQRRSHLNIGRAHAANVRRGRR